MSEWSASEANKWDDSSARPPQNHPAGLQSGSVHPHHLLDLPTAFPQPPDQLVAVHAGPGEASRGAGGGCFIEVQPSIPFWTSVLDSCFPLEPQVLLGPGGP